MSALSTVNLLQINQAAQRASEEATAARWLRSTEGNALTIENRLKALRTAVRDQADRLGFDLVERQPTPPATGALPKRHVAANALDEATYLVVDEDGTFREAQRGQTRATVIEDIATGEYEVEQVLRLEGMICEDVTAAIAAEVLARLERTGPGPKPFIPALLVERLPAQAESLRLSWMTPAEIRAERDDLNADFALEAQRDHALEAAE